VVARAQSARLARFTAVIGAPREGGLLTAPQAAERACLTVTSLPRFRDGGCAQAGELLLEAVGGWRSPMCCPASAGARGSAGSSRRARGVLGAALLALHELGQSGRAEMSGSAAGDAFSS
jgi:hypothetical protein